MNETETSKYLTNPCLLKNETIKPKPVGPEVLLLMGAGCLRRKEANPGEEMPEKVVEEESCLTMG